MKKAPSETAFDQLVNRTNDAQDPNLRPIIEKELLHYDILYCMEQQGLLDELVFQGGTALRLCHGSHRYSEDLDFCGGSDFSPSQIKGFKERVESLILRKYNLQARVKEPREGRHLSDKVSVFRWWVAVETRPGRPDIPRQRIKVEVANVEAHTSEVLPLRSSYDVLADGYSDILLNVESKNEILADKLIALPTAKSIRYRDIFDLAWLHKKGAVADSELVRRKLKDYGLRRYREAIHRILEVLPELIEGPGFTITLARLLPKQVAEKTIENDRYRQFVKDLIPSMYGDVYRELLDTGNESVGIDG